MDDCMHSGVSRSRMDGLVGYIEGIPGLSTHACTQEHACIHACMHACIHGCVKAEGVHVHACVHSPGMRQFTLESSHGRRGRERLDLVSGIRTQMEQQCTGNALSETTIRWVGSDGYACPLSRQAAVLWHARNEVPGTKWRDARNEVEGCPERMWGSYAISRFAVARGAP
eukprot:357202-Chlamydomonas_euryale.AAC.1